jgi:hypothetical protein
MRTSYHITEKAGQCATRIIARRTICRFALLGLLVNELAYGSPQPVKSLLEIRQENMVMQEWDLSCGAAALTTLLKYQHGEEVTEKEVALGLMKRPEYIKNPNMVQNREGFSLLDLKRHVDSRGYTGNGFGKMQLKDLPAKAPLIVPITVRGYNHFVVFRGIRGSRVLLADSAWGNRTMQIDEFMQSWIDHPTLGRVGFTIQRADGLVPPANRLVPRDRDFVMLR